MKKPLAVCLMILVALNLFIPISKVKATPTPVTVEDNDYSSIINKSLSIVPNITIHEVGTLKVTISWVTPSLTLQRANFAFEGESISYYALKESKEVIFTIANKSIKSTNPGFDGNIKVTPLLTTTKGEQANNITMSLTKDTKSIMISDGVTSNEIILKYAINTEFTQGPLSSNLSPVEIANLLTANIAFKIEKQ